MLFSSFTRSTFGLPISIKRRRPSLHSFTKRLSTSSSTTTVPTTAADATTSAGTTPVDNNVTVVPTITERIQARVRERNSWHMYGVPKGQPSAQEAREFFSEMFWSFRLPSRAELDEHFPVRAVDWVQLRSAATATTKDDDTIQITWLGHASLLVQMNGCHILTDPVMSSRRCSPTQWFGPLRYRPAPCTVAELKNQFFDKVDGLDDLIVLISHNHYDHLDYQTIRDITRYFPSVTFVVPLGLKGWFEYWISSKCKVQELDWHETLQYANKNNINDQKHVKITAVPMNHWSNRTGDRDRTLWCGFSVATAGDSSSSTSASSISVAVSPSKFLFAGDTAWFDEIGNVVGKTHGPWKVAALPIGAYSPRAFMKHAHVNVAEAIQIKDALQCQYAVPIHYGTFPLTTEPVLEPGGKLVELMRGRDDADSFTPWLIGETKVF